MFNAGNEAKELKNVYQRLKTYLFYPILKCTRCLSSIFSPIGVSVSFSSNQFQSTSGNVVVKNVVESMIPI